MRIDPRLFFLLFTLFLLGPKGLSGQIGIDHSSPYDSPNYLVQDVLMGQGVTATNVTFQGDPLQISYFDGSNATVPIDEGILLSTGHVDSAHGPNTDTATSTSFFEPGDEDLDSAQGTGLTEDAAVLEFDFTPVGDSIEFNYVFASEEYDQWVCSDFNDVFGFFISGPGINGPFTNNGENIALLPGTNTEVAINSVNNGSSMLDCSSFGCPCNPSYYINNYWDTSMEFDGMTVKLTAKAEVQCGETYHIKLAVGDVSDGLFDSGVFLEAESFYSPPVTVNIDEDEVPSDSTLAEGCQDATFYFVRNNTDTAATHHFDIEGNAVNGVDYPNIPDSVTFAAGEDSAGVTIDPIADGVTEGIDTVRFVLYNVTTCGDTIPEVATLYIMDEYAINTVGSDTSSACPEDTADLIVSSSGGDPPYDHTWNNGMTGDTIQVSPDSTDTLLVEATDIRGCKGIDSNVVVEVDSFVVDAFPDTTICEGDSIQLNVTPGDSFSWTPTGSLSDPSIDTPMAYPSSTTNYSVAVMDSIGCPDTAGVTVEVIPEDFLSLSPDTSICFGDTAHLNSSPLPGGSYLWSPDSTLDDETVQDPLAFPSQDQGYQLVANDSNGCVDSGEVNVSVDSLPQVDAGPSKWVCPGDSVQLEGSGATTYAWSPSSSLDDSSLQTPKASPTDTTVYTLVGTDGNGCSSSDSTRIAVTPEVPVDAGPDTSICPGDSVVIGGAPTGPPGSNYSWTPSGSLDDPNDSFPTAFPSSSTTYIVTVDNDTCSNQDTVDVLLDTLPDVDAGPIKEICVGDSVQLDGNANGTLSWNPSSSLSDSSIEDPMGSPSDTTVYTLTATDGNGCSNSDSTSIQVNEHPTAITNGDTGICRGDSIELFVGGGQNYQWTPTDSLLTPSDDSTLAFPDSTTQYQVIVTDSNGCADTASLELQVFSLPDPITSPDTTICQGDSAQLQAAGGDIYSWSPTTGLDDPSVQNPKAAPTDTTLYEVLVTDSNGCSTMDSIQVFVPSPPPVDAGSDTSICSGDSVELDASGASSYSWTPIGPLDDPSSATPMASPDSSTWFILSGTDTLGCSTTDSVLISIDPLPPVDAGSDQKGCRGDTVQLSASGADTYQWIPDSSISDPSSANTAVWPDTTQVYYLQGTDSNGCVDHDTVSVEIYRIDAEPDSSICRGETIQLQASGPNSTSYSWSPAGGLSDTSVQDPLASPDSSTIYSITATDIDGCTDVDSVELRVLSNPHARMRATQEANCEGIRWSFEDESLSNDSTIWNFGNGDEQGAEAEVLVEYGTERTATLIANDKEGCSDSSSMELRVPSFEAHFETKRPNVFTPNGDGKNDVFMLDMNGEYSDCSQLRIYNRWGQLIFRSTSGNTRWDGYTPAGKKASPGLYFYTLIVNGVKVEGELQLMD